MPHKHSRIRSFYIEDDRAVTPMAPKGKPYVYTVPSVTEAAPPAAEDGIDEVAALQTGVEEFSEDLPKEEAPPESTQTCENVDEEPSKESPTLDEPPAEKVQVDVQVNEETVVNVDHPSSTPTVEKSSAYFARSGSVQDVKTWLRQSRRHNRISDSGAGSTVAKLSIWDRRWRQVEEQLLEGAEEPLDLQRPQRSHKATLLLDTLREDDPPIYTSDAMRYEDEVETKRFLAERWIPLILVAKSVEIFENALQLHHERGVTLAAGGRLRSLLRRARNSRSNSVDSNVSPHAHARLLKATVPEFLDWPELVVESILSVSRVDLREKGDILFRQNEERGDVWILVDGTVEICHLSGGRGRAATTVTLGTVEPFRFLGLSAALLQMARWYTVAVVSPTAELLCMTRHDILSALARIGDPVSHDLYTTLIEGAKVRRTEFTTSAYPLHVSTLRQSTPPVFSEWVTPALMQLIPHLRPVFSPPGEALLGAGCDDMIVLLRGVAREMAEEGGEEERETGGAEFRPFQIIHPARCILSEGDDAGERGAVVAVTACVGYAVSREAYRAAVCAYPAGGVATRDVLARLCAMERPPPLQPPEAIVRNPVVYFLIPPPILEAWWATATPFVAWVGDLLSCKGNDVENVLLITSGLVHLRSAHRVAYVSVEADDAEPRRAEGSTPFRSAPFLVLHAEDLANGGERARYGQTVYTSSTTRGFRLPVDKLRRMLPKAILAAMAEESTAAMVARAVEEHDATVLMGPLPPRNCGDEIYVDATWSPLW